MAIKARGTSATQDGTRRVAGAGPSCHPLRSGCGYGEVFGGARRNLPWRAGRPQIRKSTAISVATLTMTIDTAVEAEMMFDEEGLLEGVEVLIMAAPGPSDAAGSPYESLVAQLNASGSLMGTLHVIKSAHLEDLPPEVLIIALRKVVQQLRSNLLAEKPEAAGADMEGEAMQLLLRSLATHAEALPESSLTHGLLLSALASHPPLITVQTMYRNLFLKGWSLAEVPLAGLGPLVGAMYRVVARTGCLPPPVLVQDLHTAMVQNLRSTDWRRLVTCTYCLAALSPTPPLTYWKDVMPLLAEHLPQMDPVSLRRLCVALLRVRGDFAGNEEEDTARQFLGSILDEVTGRVEQMEAAGLAALLECCREYQTPVPSTCVRAVLQHTLLRPSSLLAEWVPVAAALTHCTSSLELSLMEDVVRKYVIQPLETQPEVTSAILTRLAVACSRSQSKQETPLEWFTSCMLRLVDILQKGGEGPSREVVARVMMTALRPWWPSEPLPAVVRQVLWTTMSQYRSLFPHAEDTLLLLCLTLGGDQPEDQDPVVYHDLNESLKNMGEVSPNMLSVCLVMLLNSSGVSSTSTSAGATEEPEDERSPAGQRQTQTGTGSEKKHISSSQELCLRVMGELLNKHSQLRLPTAMTLLDVLISKLPPKESRTLVVRALTEACWEVISRESRGLDQQSLCRCLQLLQYYKKQHPEFGEGDLLTKLAVRCAEKASNMTPTQVSSSLLSLCRLKSRLIPVMKQLLLRALECHESFSVRQLGDVLWVVGKLGLTSTVTKSFLKQSLSKLTYLLNRSAKEGWTREQVDMMMRRREGARGPVGTAADIYSSSDSDGFSSEGSVGEEELTRNRGAASTYWVGGRLATAIWASGRCAYIRQRALQRAVHSLARHCPVLDPEKLSSVVWAFARLGQRNDDLFDWVNSWSTTNMGKASPQSVSNIVWGIWRVGGRLTKGAEDHVCRLVAEKLPDFKPQELSSLIFALAKWEVPVADDWLRGVALALRDQLHQYDGSALCTMCWSLARLGYSLEHGLIDCVEARLRQQGYCPTPSETSMFVWACLSARYHNPTMVEYMIGASLRRRSWSLPGDRHPPAPTAAAEIDQHKITSTTSFTRRLFSLNDEGKQEETELLDVVESSSSSSSGSSTPTQLSLLSDKHGVRSKRVPTGGTSSPAYITALVVALASADKSPSYVNHFRPLMTMLEQQAVQYSQWFSAEQVATYLWCCDRLHYCPEQWMQEGKLSRLLMRRATTLTWKDTFRVLWWLSNANTGDIWSSSRLQALSDKLMGALRATASMGVGDPKRLLPSGLIVPAFRAMATLKLYDTAIVDDLLQQAKSQLNVLDMDDLSWVLWSCAKMNHDPRELLVALRIPLQQLVPAIGNPELAHQATNRKELFKKSAVRLLWSHAHFNTHPGAGFFKAVLEIAKHGVLGVPDGVQVITEPPLHPSTSEDQVAADGAHWSLREVSTLLYSLTTLGEVHHPLALHAGSMFEGWDILKDPGLPRQACQLAACIHVLSLPRPSPHPLLSSLPREVVLRCLQDWKRNVLRKSRRPLRDQQQEMIAVLRALGAKCRPNEVTRDGSVCIDLAAQLPVYPSHVFAIELMGDHNLSRNTGCLVGSGALKQQLMKLHGYTVVPIVCSEWNRLNPKDPTRRMEFIQEQLRAAALAVKR